MVHESREQRLQAILHVYLQALDRGEKPDRQAILDAHPELRDELAEYFADASKLERMAKSLRTATFGGEAGGVPRTRDADATGLARIRYFGDYELLEEIARGGMGVVFKARQVSLNRIVALKMILKGELAGEADIRRFRQEAEAAANLDHPNIVPIYEVGEHEGQQYFSMKFIEVGQTFLSAAADRNVCPTAAAMLAKVARAVHHAHQRGILHRDLKPSNILIDTNGEPHVADFGLAKKVEGSEDATKSGAIVGTPAYMAPEQARAEKSLTTAVDIYSLGIVLYEWLTGRPPFRGDDAISTMMKVVSEEPAKPRSINATIDRDLETVCLKCLEKEPTKRYGSAEALVEDLERWRRGEPIRARPAGAGERFWRWCRRNPVVAGLTGGVLGLLILLAIVGSLSAWHFKRAAENERRLRTSVEEQRDAKDQALRRADGLRLVAQSEAQRPRNPGLALLLAIEGAERLPPLLADDALRSAMDACYEERTIAAHRDSIRHAWFSPDGKQILSAGYSDCMVRVWDAGTGRLLREAKVGPKEGLAAISLARFSPDGQKVLTINHDWIARVYDAATFKLLFLLKEPTREENKDQWLSDAVFSPDGLRIITAGLGTRIWDAETGEHLQVLDPAARTGGELHLSTDGRYLKDAGNVWIWELPSGKRIPIPRRKEDDVQSAVLSSDAKLWATLGKKACTLWDASTRKESGKLQQPKGEYFSDSGAFSPDGNRLLGRGIGNLVLWEIPSGKLIAEAPLRWSSASFTPDGRHILVGEDDGRIQILRSDTGQIVKTLRGHARRVAMVTLSPDGRRLLSASDDGAVRLWTWPIGPEVERRRGIWPAGIASTDGRRLAANMNSGDAIVWDIDSGEPLHHLPKGEGALFSPDLRMFAHHSQNKNNHLEIREVATNKLLCTLDDAPYMTQELFSQDSRYAFVFLQTRKYGPLWDFASGKEIARIPWDMDVLEERLEVGFSMDNRWLLMARRNQKTGLIQFGRAWDLLEKKPLPLLEFRGEPDKEYFNTFMRFSPDGRRLAVNGRDCNTLLLLDTHTGQKVAEIPGGFGGDRFSPDSKRFLLLNQVYNAEDGTLVTKLHGIEYGSGGWFSPDSKRVVAVLPDQTTRLFDAETGEPITILGRRDSPLGTAICQFVGNDRVLIQTEKGIARLVPVDPLAAARSRRPRDPTDEERRRFELTPVPSAP